MDEVAGPIAICSLSCRYPEADSPGELWDNLMDGRRSFRPIPPQRLALGAYAAETIGLADSITPVLAGLLTNWRFDRAAFRIPKASFENTDMTHWLALQLASEAIDAVGGIAQLDRGRTAVIVANTLTGEFSRASLLRLRQPFLDEILEEALHSSGTEPEAIDRVRTEFAMRLKSSFPEPNEDSLAGGLANTIAGRIANYFDLHGGAYTVDGACSSSLLAVANAVTLLNCGAADAVVTGAVDLSLDPFELVGFSRNGALARGRMRVFDARSNGFWPGEGGAFSVLMRAGDADRKGLPLRAVLRGWGMSTDGAGGLTRPDSEGQRLACARAHEMAATDPADLGYVEAHGTGTAVGDPTEIAALAALRVSARAPLPVGSVKANIGHTKAAAGFAGLIKAVLALEHGGIPPHPGCEKPHSIFEQTGGKIYPLGQAQAFEAGRSALAGVSSFGFGGINVHVVLEAADNVRRPSAAPSFVPRQLRGEQGAELFVFQAPNADAMREALLELCAIAPRLSLAQLADAAALAARRLDEGDLRLACVAGDGEELGARLADALAWLDAAPDNQQPPRHIFFGRRGKPEPIGFLFSGQAAPVRELSPVWLARFPVLRDLARGLPRISEDRGADTAVAQPAITYADLAALAVLQSFGVEAAVAAGHSLGEISALAWSGAIEPQQALDLAASRAALMARHGRPGGGMARIGLPADEARRFIRDIDCCVACLNGRDETVISGSQEAMAALSQRALRADVDLQPLNVSHAFHSADMAPVADPFRAVLNAVRFAPPSKLVVSTVTRRKIAGATGLAGLLCDQLVQPVQFVAALEEMAKQASLFIELGPGSGLKRLAAGHGLRAVAVDSQSDDMTQLLSTLATVFTAGHDLEFGRLFDGRGTRCFDSRSSIELLSNPCGSRRGFRKPAAPGEAAKANTARMEVYERAEAPQQNLELSEHAVLEATLSVTADETGLPVAAISPDARFQSDLHLNSLAVTRIVVAICKRLGRQAMRNPTDFADATPAILASQLAEMAEFRSVQEEAPRVNGIRRWAASYGMVWYRRDVPEQRSGPVEWSRDLSTAQSTQSAQTGLLISLPEAFGTNEAIGLVAELQQALHLGITRLAVIHNGLPVSAFFRSLGQENAFETVMLVDRRQAAETDLRIGRLLASAPKGFAEYRLADGGSVEVPVFERHTPRTGPAGMPDSGDVVLAVGCHRGIGSESAFLLSAKGARLVFAGRSRPTDPAVADLLEMARSRGITASYEQCDVADPLSVGALAHRLGAAGTTPTNVLFAPAVNQPMRLTSLTPDVIEATLSPKVAGLRSVLDTFGGGLKQVIAFGSIIGRIGLEGECHYAVANAIQSAQLEDFARAHPLCRCLSLEWTVWSGSGMGERLGTIERLEAQGVDALAFDEALAAFERHIRAGSEGTVAITGRFGSPEGLETGVRPTKPLRFIDHLLVEYPGTELVAETEVNIGRDPYLSDHCIDGRSVLPGVLGIEAMAQAVSALAGEDFCRKVTNVTFHRAAIVGRAGLRIRIAALRIDDDCVETALFTEDDAFQSPAFSARFHFAPENSAVAPAEPVRVVDRDPEAADATLLYGSLFFQGPGFARLERVHDVSSRLIDAGLGDCGETVWFGAFEPGAIVFGDPGVADAALHALQATIPHLRVLPLSIGALTRWGNLTDVRRIIGKENWTRNKVYSFDITAYDGRGRSIAAWRDVRFKAIGETAVDRCLRDAPLLCQPYLERLAREELGDETIRLSLVCDTGVDQAQRRQRAIDGLALDSPVVWRSDGRPMLCKGDGYVGLSHSDTASLAIYGDCPVACDIARLDTSYPRLANRDLSAQDWAVAEVMRKLGHPAPFGAKPGSNAAFAGLAAAPAVVARNLSVHGLAVALGSMRGSPTTDHSVYMQALAGVPQ